MCPHALDVARSRLVCIWKKTANADCRPVIALGLHTHEGTARVETMLQWWRFGIPYVAVRREQEVRLEREPWSHVASVTAVERPIRARLTLHTPSPRLHFVLLLHPSSVYHVHVSTMSDTISSAACELGTEISLAQEYHCLRDVGTSKVSEPLAQ